MGAEIDRLEIQVQAQASQANKQLDTLIAKLNDVSKSLSGINGSEIANGVGRVSKSMQSVNNISAKSSSALSHLYGTLGTFVTKSNRAQKSSRSLASSFGLFYANCFLAIRGVKALGRAVEKSMDYVETYNYFSVTMDKIGKEFGGMYAQYGYDSAEAYSDSFSERMNSLTTKMSGFKAGDDGVMSFSGMKNLSLDPEAIMNYQASISAITNSVGLVGENSINASKALTMLSADMSSLKNIDMKTVMTNFQSGLIGQSRALYKYGIDITNATLQTYAYKYGLSTAVSEMAQADKMQLRLLAILDQSKVAWGDQANTINSVANQFRIFKQQISNVARAIGNLLIPALQVVLPVVNGIMIAFQKLIVFIGGLFGIDYSKIMDGISGGFGGGFDMDDSGLEDTADSAGAVGDNLDDANKKAKKFQRTLLGFDQINKLNDNTEDASSGSSGGSDGGAGGIDLSDAISGALSEYQAVWDKALVDSQNKAQKYADNICAIFNTMWQKIKAGDFEGLSIYIAGGVDSLFQKINSVFNWGKVGPGITGFVSGFTTTVNGLTSNINWTAIGETFGSGLNVITNTIYLFLTGINWASIGSSIASGLNGMIATIDWDMLGKSIGAWIMVWPGLISGFISELDWSGLGSSIGTALNGALSEIDLGTIGATIGMLVTGIFGSFSSFASKFDWVEFGDNIASGINNLFKNFDGKTVADGINGMINGLLTTLTTAIGEIDWSAVVKGIGDVLGNLDWGALTKIGLTIAAVKLSGGLLGSIKKAVKLLTVDKIAGVLGGIGEKITTGITNAVGKISLSGIFGKLFTSALPSIGSGLASIGSTIAGGIGTVVATLGGPLTLAITGAIAGIIAVICNWDAVKEFFTVTLPTWWNETVVPWIQCIPEFFSELPGKIWGKIIGVKDKFVTWASSVISTIAIEVPKIISKVTDFFDKLPEKIGYAIGFAIGKLISWVGNMIKTVATEVPKIIKNIGAFFSELPGKIWGKIIGVKDKFVTWASSVISTIAIEVPKIISKVVGFFKELPGKIYEKLLAFKETIVRWGKDAIGWCKSEIPKILNSIINWFNKLPGKLVEVGKNMLKSIWNGITSMGSWLMDKITGFFGGIGEGLTDALGLGKGGEVSVKPISGFAKGGFPNTGQLFMARENGINEMIGRIGNRSTVANNGQIVDGISSGVYEAVMAAKLGGGSGTDSAPVIELTLMCDSETIYRAVKKGERISNKRYQVVTQLS